MGSSNNTRKYSHSEKKEPFLEHFLSWMRFRKVHKYINNNALVADLGCGYRGYLLQKISRRIKKGVGYDISVAKTGLPDNIILRKTNLNKNIKNGKNYYDVVTALAVLEHVENPKSFVKMARSLLKKGGKFIITTPHKKSKLILEFLSNKLGLISEDEIKDHKNYFDKERLKDLLQKGGFKNVKIRTFEMGLNLLAVSQKTN